MKDDGLTRSGNMEAWAALRAQEPVPTDADLAYLGLTEHQIGLINAIPPGEGQDAVRCEVAFEQARILMENESGHDSLSTRFGDLI